MDEFHGSVATADGELGALRAQLAAWLATVGLSEPARSALVLATHEGIANALTHSGSPDPVEVDGHVEDETVTIDVTDHGHVGTIVDERLGFRLIRASAATAAIGSTDDGTTLRLTQPLRRRRALADGTRKERRQAEGPYVTDNGRS